MVGSSVLRFSMQRAYCQLRYWIRPSVCKARLASLPTGEDEQKAGDVGRGRSNPRRAVSWPAGPQARFQPPAPHVTGTHLAIPGHPLPHCIRTFFPNPPDRLSILPLARRLLDGSDLAVRGSTAVKEGPQVMSDMQQRVQEAIDQLVESGAERGLQVAVYRHGELVVDAVAGVADSVTGRVVT